MREEREGDGKHDLHSITHVAFVSPSKEFGSAPSLSKVSQHFDLSAANTEHKHTHTHTHTHTQQHAIGGFPATYMLYCTSDSPMTAYMRGVLP